MMPRNLEHNFSLTPSVTIGRSRFERPFNHKFTFDVGTIVPFYWTEILPGDSVKMKTSKVVRMSTFLDPVMDNLFLDTYYFFVPWRLVWDHTKEFFGENSSGAWIPQTTYTIPYMETTNSSANNKVKVQTIADYMGIPVGVDGLKFSALPIRAVDLVYDEWFRDQNLQSPPVIYKGDSSQVYDASVTGRGGKPWIACKLHDYFTSGSVAPQKGPAVHLPLTGSIPVNIQGTSQNVTATGATHAMGSVIKFGTPSSDGYLVRSGFLNGTAELSLGETSSTPNFTNLNYSNLVVNWPSTMTANLSGASPITVNDLRMAFQMQKFYEKASLFGSRYNEFLHSHFGVISPDARLQRSEYLGGNRIPIQVHQVEQTVSTSTPLAHLGAYSATSDVDDSFTHSFVEHGFLLGFCVARYKHTYSQGLERAWSRDTVFSVYDPLFANLGNMPIMQKEIYATGTSSDDNVFAYQECWADYRYQPDRVSGYMRPGISGSLASWHYADYYTTDPALSASWIVEDKSMVDRTLAVTSSQAPQLFADFLCDAVFVRPMPLYSVPGLIDHH